LAQTGAGSIPGLSIAGSTNNLVSVDALQEFKVQTSTYAPEFGRTPGGQVAIVTRSGTNRVNGTLFEYFRNDVLDANDWFANSRGLPKPRERQNDFGGVLGGPLPLPRFGEGGPSFLSGKNRTFFFFSYEGLRLSQPLTGTSQVPSELSRQAAPPSIAPFFSAFPHANGAATSNGLALFSASFSVPTTLNATSIRIDHVFGKKLTVFGRYNIAPSETISRAPFGGSLSQISPTTLTTRTLTLAATLGVNPKVSNELRVNWSWNRGQRRNDLDTLGGAVPVPTSQWFPLSFGPNSNFNFNLNGGTFIQQGFTVNNVQRQLNLVDNLSAVHGTHQMKFGVDYRRFSPEYVSFRNTAGALFAGATGAVTGQVAIGIISTAAGPFFLSIDNFSAYGQDTWRAARHLTLTYGLRWDIDGYPSERNGNYPTAVSGLDNPSTMTLAPAGTKLWQTTYNNFAPRVGVAYQLSDTQGRETVLRGGFGVFYDLLYGSVLNSFSNSWPSVVFKFLPAGTPFPFDATAAAPPSLSRTPPAGTLYLTDPNLRLPRTYEWNLAVERSLGASQTVSASYVGAAGRRLLRQEQLTNPNPTFTTVLVTRNTATSNYHAMQLQYNRRLSKGLQALASYTWSRSIDTASNDSVSLQPAAVVSPIVDRGPSDFDVRHAFAAAVTYSPPTTSLAPLLKTVLGGWSIDPIFTARSATPVNVTTTTDVLGLGVSSVSRPDLVQGVPLYITDPTVAGGRRFNRAAFSIPPANSGRQGTLGRNALRGFPVYQIDLALRRRFSLTERLKLQFSSEFFNIFNHPNFADPQGSLGSNGVPNALFGQSTTMLGRSLGSGGVAGGFSPLYQIGGPRSIQLALRLSF
jgi:hypothetical protein